MGGVELAENDAKAFQDGLVPSWILYEFPHRLHVPTCRHADILLEKVAVSGDAIVDFVIQYRLHAEALFAGNNSSGAYNDGRSAPQAAFF